MEPFTVVKIIMEMEEVRDVISKLLLLDKIDSNVKRLVSNPYKTAVRTLKQAQNSSSPTETKTLLRKARDLYNQAIGLEDNERKILAYISLASCHKLLGDQNNAHLTLNEAIEVDTQGIESKKLKIEICLYLKKDRPWELDIDDRLCFLSDEVLLKIQKGLKLNVSNDVDQTAWVKMLTAEIKSISGHSAANVKRKLKGEERSYKDILLDIANLVKSNKNSFKQLKNRSNLLPQDIEVYILKEMDISLKERWEKLTEKQRDKETEKIREKMRSDLNQNDPQLLESVNRNITTRLITKSIRDGMFYGGGSAAILSTFTVMGISVGLSTVMSSLGASIVYYFWGTWAAAGAFLGGGAAGIGLAAVAAPAAALVAANMAAQPSYKKLTPVILLIIASPEAMSERELISQNIIQHEDDQKTTNKTDSNQQTGDDRAKMVKRIEKARRMQRDTVECLKCGLRVKVDQALSHFDKC